MRAILAAGLVTLLAVPLGSSWATAAPHRRDECRVERDGHQSFRHDPRADLNFSAILVKNGRQRHGEVFEFGKVTTILIEVRWRQLTESARQRVELYAPDGNLYQMFTTSLPDHPDPVEIRVPVLGSWIMQSSLVGEWCAKVFLDDDTEPLAADSFQLKFRKR